MSCPSPHSAMRFYRIGDAELTDRELLAQGRHMTPKVLPKYVKRTTRQIMTGTKKAPGGPNKGRTFVRMKSACLSEWKAGNAISA